MVLTAQLNPHVGYVQTGECYAKNGGYSNPRKEEYYGTPVYQQQEDFCSENDYYNNSGSSMQQVRHYPNITAPQPSKHHVVHYEGYDQLNDGYYGKPQGYKDHDFHGYDKQSNNDAYYEKPHGYKEHNSHGYDKHSYGKHHTDSMYGKPQNYDMNEVQGYAKYSNGPNRYESMSYNNYYAEHYDNKTHQDWASKGAQWILKSLDD